jgi:hypothetical protein
MSCIWTSKFQITAYEGSNVSTNLEEAEKLNLCKEKITICYLLPMATTPKVNF